MTKFDASKFMGTEYVTYDGAFVARFKRGGRGSFIKFLVKNFTVEEYFQQLAAGVAPLTVLRNRGYMPPTVARVLRAAGYPTTEAGYKQYLDSVCRAAVSA